MDCIQTEWGNARKNCKGYFTISSRKEGNHGKYLHRLIYESFWGVKLPKEIIIHHKDENPSNNCILNLEALSKAEHQYVHKGSGTGYYRVIKHKREQYKQGFIYEYRYYEDGKKKYFISTSLEELEKKVKENGFEWKKIDDIEYNEDLI